MGYVKPLRCKRKSFWKSYEIQLGLCFNALFMRRQWDGSIESSKARREGSLCFGPSIIARRCLAESLTQEGLAALRRFGCTTVPFIGTTEDISGSSALHWQLQASNWRESLPFRAPSFRHRVRSHLSNDTLGLLPYSNVETQWFEETNETLLRYRPRTSWWWKFDY